MSEPSYMGGSLHIKEETVDSDTELSHHERYEIARLKKNKMLLSREYNIAQIEKCQKRANRRRECGAHHETALVKKDQEIASLRQDLVMFEKHFGVTASQIKGPFC